MTSPIAIDTVIKGIQFGEFDSMASVPERFNPLFEQASRESIFFSRLWFELLERYVFPESVRIFALEFESEPEPEPKYGKPLLILPCYESVNKGRHLHVLSNYYSSLFTMPLVATESVPLDALFLTLFKAIDRFNYQSITFEPLDNGKVEYACLLSSLKRCGYFVDAYFSFGNWYERVTSDDFSAYYQQRPSKLRNTIRRKAKKLEAVEITIVSSFDEVQALLPQYQAIYAASWKTAETYPLFVENMVLSLAKKNQLRLGVATIDNVPAAAQIWLVSDGVDGAIASIYKLAYDPRFKNTSIGSILTAALFEFVIEKDRVSEIDCLTGDDAYKKDWMTQRRERWAVVAYNKKTLWGFGYGLKAIVAPWVKKYILKA
ncbi:GNAT family N-acetyltransferase [sulfur-oxidizing endosymbiont of Gigantopelta aegis]|uniref:GNAT family N-acetyltransferase n=1 Tax=sulfur-oxidizing endosymbiont of Gigantopelta aegis TaxID=2794934 RepID=UPI0018DB0EC6|nr:GNAT family N-acetyltransferase [sulfur-oxidizing endosymbiont of Gigantopelta aegis]